MMEREEEKRGILSSQRSSMASLSASVDEHVPLHKTSWWQQIPKRYLIAVMTFLGFCNVYILRANLSVAIVDMVAKKPLTKNGTLVYEAEFDWDFQQQGSLLAAFFYGYIVTQIPGGWLANMFGGKRVFGIGVMATALLTLLTPPAAQLSFYAIFAIRVLEGLAEGLAYPASHAIWSCWAPPQEKTKLATVAFSGSYVGMMLAFPVSGLLVQHLGWPSVFYFSGGAALVWWIFWVYAIRESPEQHETISRHELEFIQTSMGTNYQQWKDQRVPWGHIFTSLPMWAIIIAHFSENWGFYMMMTGLPTFLRDVLHFELQKAGFIAALPYLVLTICLQAGGQISDWLRGKRYFTTTQVRKLFNCIGFGIQTAFMLGAAFAVSAPTAISCLTIAIGVGGFAWSAFGVNHLDIAPQYASLLMGISNCIATIPGIVSPVVSGSIVVNKSANEWQIVFFITAGIYMGGAIFYGLFASGEQQDWAEVGKEEYTAYGDVSNTPDEQPLEQNTKDDK